MENYEQNLLNLSASMQFCTLVGMIMAVYTYCSGAAMDTSIIGGMAYHTGMMAQHFKNDQLMIAEAREKAERSR